MGELVRRIEEKSARVTIGDPLDPGTDIGPLCTAAQIERIEQTLKTAVSQGATIRSGGGRPQGFKRGNYFVPTLVECPDTSVETLKVEMFGSVMSLVAFDGEEEAVAMGTTVPTRGCSPGTSVARTAASGVPTSGGCSITPILWGLRSGDGKKL